MIVICLPRVCNSRGGGTRLQNCTNSTIRHRVSTVQLYSLYVQRGFANKLLLSHDFHDSHDLLQFNSIELCLPVVQLFPCCRSVLMKCLMKSRSQAVCSVHFQSSAIRFPIATFTSILLLLSK